MVGIYMTFLKLDLAAMRRMEHIAIISVFQKQANLQLVLHKITEQLMKLTEGLPILDASKQARIDDSKITVYAVARGRDGQLVRIPIRRVFPRVALSLGDAVLQAYMGGCRTVTSTFLCRCCFCCQSSTVYKSTVYDLSDEILDYRFGKIYFR